MPPIGSSPSDGLRVLILDGGDLRSLSQLEILREYMRRIQFDMGDAVRPYQVFDLVAGVGPAGILAFLLGALGLTIEEASEQFDRCCRDLLLDDQLDAETRSQRLETLLKDIISASQITENQKLCDPTSRIWKTKVALYFMSSTNLGRCRVFRNYESRQYEYDATIIEAVRATCSMPPLFTPVHIGFDHQQEELVTAMLGYSNPIKEVIKELLNTYGPSRKVQLILSIGAGKRVPLSIKGKGISLEDKAAQEAESLAEELREQFRKTGVYFRFSVDRGIEILEQARDQHTSTIYSNTSAYLSQKEVDKSLDRAIRASSMSSLVTLEKLGPAPSLATRSANGLPPLSAFFVMRQAPMDTLVNGLLTIDRDNFKQRIVVVSGMGGLGKTQITLAFARANESWFRHILFVDASSVESIENGLIARGGAIDRALIGCTAQDVLSALSRPDEAFTTDWLLILDNADDPALDIREFIPECDHGSVLITTRNPNLGNLTSSHLQLDVMTPEEAVDALLTAALGSNSSKWSEKELATAHEIVKTLGCLPVAVIQAGAMIKRQQCLHDYTTRLKRNRSKLLQNSSLQRDKLRYPHSVYAAFDTTLKVLSEKSLQLLSILSFLHYTGFPKAVFGIAAKYGFKYQLYDIEEREEDFEESVQLLNSILTRDGVWDEDSLDEILDELQQYSLVALIPGYNADSVTLRFHPLLHAWAQDRLSPFDRTRFRASAVRLVCGATNFVDSIIGNRLITHIDDLTREMKNIHINDQAALDSIQRRHGKTKNSLALWKEAHQTMHAKYGPDHGRTALATLMLGAIYGEEGDRAKMEELEKVSIEKFSQFYGPHHPMTLEATQNLARTYRNNNDLNSAELLNQKVLQGYEETNPNGLEMSDALMELATTLMSHQRPTEARALVLRALEIRENNLGRAHFRTVHSIQVLAATYERENRYAEAEPLRSEALDLQRMVYGDEGSGALTALNWLAWHYWHQKRFVESEKLFTDELQGRRKVHGPTSENCHQALRGLLTALDAQEKYDIVDSILREELPMRLKISGETHNLSLMLQEWMATNLHAQQKYDEAETVWKELLEKRRSSNAAETLVLTALHGWGDSLVALGRLKEGENALKEELERRIAIHGERNALTLDSMHCLGHAIFERDDFQEAEKLWRSELDQRRTLATRVDRNGADAIHSLSRVLIEQDQYVEAEQLAREEISIRLELHGRISNDTGIAYFGLGFALLGQKKLKEAEEAFKENWDIQKTAHGDDNNETLEAKHWVAHALVEQKRYEEAEAIFIDELAAKHALNGDASDESIETLHCLGECYFLQEKFEQAEKIWRDELVSASLDGESSENALAVMHSLSKVLPKLEKHEEAEKLASTVLECRRAQLTPSDSRISEALHVFGQILLEKGEYDKAEKLIEEEYGRRKAAKGEDHTATIKARDLLVKVKARANKQVESRDEDAPPKEVLDPIQNSLTHATQGPNVAQRRWERVRREFLS